MTTTSASQCVWVATCTKDPCAELVSNGFSLVSPGFPPSFLGSLLKKHRESWVIFGGICEGPPVLDVLICSHFESTVLRILTSKLQKVLGLSCQPTKVVISKQNFQIPGESHGLSDFSRMIWVSICHLPLCPADL